MVCLCVSVGVCSAGGLSIAPKVVHRKVTGRPGWPTMHEVCIRRYY